MSGKKRILIAAHTFPPYSGIGGRRWAKFAKYFEREGHDVSVISADLGQTKNSNWTQDVRNVKHSTYPHKFPAVLSSDPSTVVKKMSYRLALKRMLRKSKGTPYDRALLDKVSFQEKLKSELSDKHPDILIVTGAPFMLLVYAADLKADFPETTFVADFRDPWTWGTSYGYKALSPKRLAFEKGLEQKVCEVFDVITSPWPEIIEKLKLAYPSGANKMKVLSHGYDPDDVQGGQVAFGESPTTKKILYGGTIYDGMVEQLIAIGQIALAHTDEFTVDIYASSVSQIEGVEGIDVKSSLPSVEFFQKAREADFLLFPIPEHLKDGVPTKLYEYAALRKPVLAFGHKGKVSDFVEQNGMGVFIESFKDIPSFINENKKFTSDGVWFKAYAFESIVSSFLSEINQLKTTK